MKHATIYNICDGPILKSQTISETWKKICGKLYRKLFGNPLLKHFLLRWCSHPEIPMQKVEIYRKHDVAKP